jgi:hypothetical protein
VNSEFVGLRFEFFKPVGVMPRTDDIIHQRSKIRLFENSKILNNYKENLEASFEVKLPILSE